MRGRLIIGTALVGALITGCTGGDNGPGDPGAAPSRSTLARFESDAAFNEYFDDLAVVAARRMKDSASEDGDGTVAADSAETSAAAPTATAATGTDESITNNQEVGVDEGDIVKRLGDSLVVLRQGRLYAIDISVPGAPIQTDGVDVAPDPALNQDVWYDEAIVHDDRIYVIGYRYSVTLSGTEPGDGWRGATEITSFQLRDGRFDRLASTFVESYDYFSGSNYASRLVDGHLVMYQLNGAWSQWDGERVPTPQIPRYLAWNASTGTFDVGEPTFAPTDVYRPIHAPEYPAFHAAMRCELPDDGSLSCTTRALLGDGWSEHYVSSSRIYLWTEDLVYAVTLADQTASAHAATGYPTDQFAFAERGNTLHVIVSDHDANVSMVSLPVGAFDDRGEQSLDGLTRPLAAGWVTAQRWVGDTAILAISTPPDVDNEPVPEPFIEDVPLAEDDGGSISSDSSVSRRNDTARQSLVAATVGSEPIVRSQFAPVDRIEALGAERALVVAQDGAGTIVDVVDVRTAAAIGSTRLDGAREGESRSHAFSFNGSDLLGLPIHGSSTDWDRWGGASDIAFFALSSDATLTLAGTVGSSGVPTNCATSCTDWYGNTRPIFTDGRVFALMGSELVEATRTGTPPTVVSGGRVTLG